jgi:hypothetical protein
LLKSNVGNIPNRCRQLQRVPAPAVRGGGGWVGNSASLTNLSTGASMSAWLGAGVEWAFAPQWSASLEYNYL